MTAADHQRAAAAGARHIAQRDLHAKCYAEVGRTAARYQHQRSPENLEAMRAALRSAIDVGSTYLASIDEYIAVAGETNPGLVMDQLAVARGAVETQLRDHRQFLAQLDGGAGHP